MSSSKPDRKERDKAVATGLVVLFVVLWLGFIVHRSPRFPGSLVGSLLGIAGSLLMLIPLAYLVVKRFNPLKAWVTPRVSMRTLLAWHIYAGILGPILVLVHTGHKFESPLGVALTSMTIVVVLSGFVGRYLMSRINREIREKKDTLDALSREHQSLAAEVARQRDFAALLPRGLLARLGSALFIREPEESGFLPAAVRALRVTESMADVEYAVRTHETFKAWFAKWLKIHIVISCGLYVLMALHVWAGFYFGLRWLA